MTIQSGFGVSSFGQGQFGHVDTDFESRFDASFPVDGASGISVFGTLIRFDVYCFSDRVQSDRSLLVEISENGGTLYSNAYYNGNFVSPYNGANSRVDAHLGDPHVFTVVIHRTSLWDISSSIRVRVTAFDEYGNEATKTSPVKW